jgi:spore maturation protein SpmA/spore maturation protein SpmB
MLNWIWLGLLLLGALVAGFGGRLPQALEAAFGGASKSTELAIGLVGVMTLWLGLMRLAEVSGLVQFLALVLRPLLVRLFPDVPANHPAMGSMVLNLSANALGLTNAATPLGLRAMKDLESLNPRPGTATDAMCTFLALNTGSLQLLPISAIAVLTAAGARSPTSIIGTTLLATACSSIVGLGVIKLLARLPIFRLPPAITDARSGTTVDDTPSAMDPGILTTPQLSSASRAWLASLALVCVFCWFGWNLVSGQMAGAGLPTDPLWMRALNALSLLAVPFLLAFFPLFAAVRGIAVYEHFIEGAKEGFQTAIRIIPYLVAILVAIGFFRGAGGIELLGKALARPMAWVGFPMELLPMVLLRPLTGSGTLAAFSDVVRIHGADSLLARTAGTIFGSTETTFYVIAVYFGSVNIRRTRHAIWAGLAADLAGAVAAVHVCRWMFASGT